MNKEQEKSQKDNPVSSLEKLIDELFHKYKWSEERRITYIDKLSLAHLMDFTKFLKENLQNDVRTEQSETKRCSGACENGQYYDCSNYCTRYGGKL